MKRARWLTLLLMTIWLSAVPLYATPPLASNGHAAAPTSQPTPFLTHLAHHARSLFFELAPLAAAEPTVVAFSIDVRGQLFATETVTVQRSPDAGAWGEREGIELMSGSPSQLAELDRRAAAGDDVRVDVKLDGQRIAEYSWAELNARSAELVETGFRPLALQAETQSTPGAKGASSLRNLFAATTTPVGCANDCDTAYATCGDNCDSRPIPNCDANA